ncbi:MAG: hypothetical protein WBX16_24935 [Candidatus Acidiferrales bacterium]
MARSAKGPLDMLKGLTVSGIAVALAVAGLAAAPHRVTAHRLALADPPATDTLDVASGLGLSEQNRPSVPAGQAPSDAEIQARTQKLIDNQHRNDDALEQYERIERHVDQTAGDTPRVLEDRLYRVVPTGTGTMKLLLKDNGKPVDPADYHKQLTAWRDLLQIMLKPDDPRTKSANEKWQKKKQDRKELVDAARDAFLTKWLRQETRNGRLCDVFQVDPNPDFHAHSIAQEVLTRVAAKIWVDHATDQLVRGEAHIIRDLSFGGGILGKLYRGGVFSLDQAEVTPGIWLPTRYQYDFTARKFLFTFAEHQYIEVSEYHRDGSANQCLALVQNELATGRSTYGDP